jgi:hypothetical protein
LEDWKIGRLEDWKIGRFCSAGSLSHDAAGSFPQSSEVLHNLPKDFPAQSFRGCRSGGVKEADAGGRKKSKGIFNNIFI